MGVAAWCRLKAYKYVETEVVGDMTRDTKSFTITYHDYDIQDSTMTSRYIKNDGAENIGVACLE